MPVAGREAVERRLDRGARVLIQPAAVAFGRTADGVVSPCAVARVSVLRRGDGALCELRKAVEQALAASFVARRAKADVAKDLLNKDWPPTADDIRQALEDGGWAKELRAISASRRVEAPSLH